MSEEEKKAIGKLRALNELEKKCKIDQTFYNFQIKRIMITLVPEDFGVFDILLNLIEKQAKKIEELKEKIGNAKDILEDYQNGLYTMKERKSMSDTHIEMAIYYLESEE